MYSGLLEPVLANRGRPTWRTLVLWSAGTDSGRWGPTYQTYACILDCWNRFWQVVAGLPGVHLYSGLLEPVLASGGWPTWRTLVFWSSGTSSVRLRKGLPGVNLYSGLLNRFWQVGAGLPGVLVLWSAGTGSGRLEKGLPGVHLFSGLLEPVLASGGWPIWPTLVV